MLPASNTRGSKPTITFFIAIGYSIMNPQRESISTNEEATHSLQRVIPLRVLPGKTASSFGKQPGANCGIRGNRLPRIPVSCPCPPSVEPSFPHQVFIGRIRAGFSLQEAKEFVPFNLKRVTAKDGGVDCLGARETGEPGVLLLLKQMQVFSTSERDGCELVGWRTGKCGGGYKPDVPTERRHGRRKKAMVVSPDGGVSN